MSKLSERQKQEMIKWGKKNGLKDYETDQMIIEAELPDEVWEHYYEDVGKEDY